MASIEISDGAASIIIDDNAGSLEITQGSGDIAITEVGVAGPPGASIVGPAGIDGTNGTNGLNGIDANVLTVPRTEVNDVNYTLLVTDYLVVYTHLSLARTINIPFALLASGRTFKFKDESGLAGTYNVTLLPEAGHGTLIDGQTSIKLELNYDAVSIHGSGTNWHVEA